MTVYWVDPYIDTTKGGIHGTTSTTTRNGNYATPFGLVELFSAMQLQHSMAHLYPLGTRSG